MREMTNVFAGVGLMVITGRTFYYLSLVANTIFFFAFFFSLVLTSDNSNSDSKNTPCTDNEESTKKYGTWAMVVAFIAATSLICFT